MSNVLDRLFQQAVRKLKTKGLTVEADDSNSLYFIVLRANGFPVDSPSGNWQFSKMDVIQFSEREL
ncbi:hypothetical protein [Gloeobacter morelensis]|uniref:Uncharacterized protein n=1 Tax=Gloeobacter morelensis MG652769 TaxID=2781736 RepID=A0ABY3PMG4_9CYAN|nr:hypothetical protein [Gloeobacter morelensis]UFP94868.1 hypothetical protein ISF26_01045 [Gloeobacter morelensis MG652769]